MATVITEETGTGFSSEGVLSEQQQICQSGEALAEWRSSEQLENGVPSTSPPYWDSDDDDDGGPKPSELYGKYTWKIDKFSQINKRELRSNAFEVGGYKWYILIYPQGCDVCNHLSLFLCVANHDKLLPGWSHFAQFTIAVVNKDPKKSKYSDTLHRFWKKEHDWGWKKFMELSKVFDGFIDADTLVIKAQVQVIREKADRPFRCLDCQYRRELIRVYLTNVEQICRRFVEERRSKLGKLIEDKVRWSSFCAFWLSMDKSSRRRMSREKTESLLKIVVKHFFIEKEVTSTLVMDSLYSGLKALEGPYKDKKTKGKYLEAEELSLPVVRMEEDMFVLIDDVLSLLERAAMEPLPPKDEKGPQNRMKDGSAGEEFNKDSIERDERRLTQLGRLTVEMFILAHIFSKIEVAYKEAVSLKKQEELIREEEAAWLAEIEHKARRGLVEKEKKSKKKQGKQKRNNRKGKDKGRYDKSNNIVQVGMEQDNCNVDKKDFGVANEEMTLEKSDAADDVSDVSDPVDFVPETLPPDSGYRDVSPANWDTDTSEVHPPTEASSSGINGLSSVQNENDGRSSSVVDDSSSLSSSDSVPSTVALSVPHKSNSRHQKNRKSSSRLKNHQIKPTSDSASWINEETSHPSELVPGGGYPKPTRISNSGDFLPRVDEPEHRAAKEEQIGCVQRNLSTKYEVVGESWGTAAAAAMPPSRSVTEKNAPIANQKLVLKSKSNPSVGKKPSSGTTPKQADISVSLANSSGNVDTQKTNAQNPTTPKPLEQTSRIGADNCQVERVTVTADKLVLPQMPVISRPMSAPLIPVSRAAVSVVPTVPASPVLARSASVAGRLGTESSAPTTQSYVPQSYRNAMMGAPAPAPVSGTALPYSQNHTASSVVNPSFAYSQAPARASTELFSQQSSDRMDQNQMPPTFSFGMVNPHDIQQNGRPVWTEFRQRDGSRNLPGDNNAALCGDTRNFDSYSSHYSRSHGHHPPAIHSLGRQAHVAATDEFPYLDIINDLLDDENGIGGSSISESNHPSFLNGGHNRTHLLSHQFSFPGDAGMMNGSFPQVGFERTRSFNDDIDRFQHSRYALGSSSETLRDMIHHAGPGSYANGHVAGLIPSHWQISGSERPILNMRSSEREAYPYRLQEYQNLSLGINGYPPVFRP